MKRRNIKISSLNYEEVERNSGLLAGAEYHLINDSNVNHYANWEVECPDVIYKAELDEEDTEEIDLRCNESLEKDQEIEKPSHGTYIGNVNDVYGLDEARKKKREELERKGAISLAGRTTPNGTSLDGVYWIPPQPLTIMNEHNPPNNQPTLPPVTRAPSPMMNVRLKNKLKTTLVKDDGVSLISDIIDIRSPAGDIAIINAIINSEDQG